MTSGPTVGVVTPHLIHHHEHDGLGNNVTDSLTDDTDIGVDKITNGLNLSLQLGINGVQLRVLQVKVGVSNPSTRPGSSWLLTSFRSELVA